MNLFIRIGLGIATAVLIFIGLLENMHGNPNGTSTVTLGVCFAIYERLVDQS
jgi:hypothetical protein